ncbi:MAG: carboxypeptidase regulatory-like domain-containing protein [Chloroflexi bacterium]|nr:carboxypeptidase regulatory-like domain-containing protein [Chloroflexota bacterium]
MSRQWFLAANRTIPLLLTTLLLMICSAAAVSGQSTGHITGTITDENTGAPLAGIRVNAHQATGSWEIRGSAITGADGFYDVGGLEPGAYRVEFSDPAGDYSAETYDNAPDVSAGRDVQVSAGQTTAGINAALAGAGHIVGRVTAQATGDPLPGIRIRVCRRDGARCQWLWDSAKQDFVSTFTRVDGAYDLGGLLSGVYRVRFSDPTGIYYTEFYDSVLNDTEATDVRVGAGQTTPDVNAALPERGSIAGKVTDRISDQPLSGIRVGAYIPVGGWPPWAIMGTAATDAAGSYRIGLAADVYRVEFTDPTGVYAPGDPVDATVYNHGITSGIDATLVPWGRITGTVTAQASGEPLAGIQMALYQWNGAWWEEKPAVMTGSDGSYDSGSLTADTYRIRFSDPNRRYQTRFYAGAADIESATAVSVTLGRVTAGVNAALVERGRITGTITAEGAGQPLAGIQVTFAPAASWGWGDATATVTSAADGGYNSGGLDANLYRLRFADPNGKYASWELGSGVRVIATETTAGIDVALHELGRITGRVTAHDTGLPLSDIRVTLYHCYWYDGSRGWRWICDGGNTTPTAPDGRYEFRYLVDGFYELEFADSQGIYVAMRTDKIQLVDNQAITSMDAALDRWESITGHITGTVTAQATGAPLVGIGIATFSCSGAYCWSCGQGWTNADGGYNLAHLSPGSYRLGFWDPAGRFEGEFFDNATSVETGADIHVTAAATTSHVNAALIERGHITGRVIARATGKPLSGITVGFWQGGDWWKAWTSTDDEGVYDSGYLPAGVYRVWFSHPDGEYQVQVYPHARSIEAGADVTVTLAHETAGIDVALIASGGITGRVTDQATGNPLPGIGVGAYLATQSYWQSDAAVTDADGLYEITDLPSGVYRVQYAGPSARYFTEFYDDATSLAAGADVRVLAPRVTAGINAALTEKERNRIAGTVADQGTGAPLPDIRVDLFSNNGQNWYWLRAVTTATDGAYDSGKLVDGVYRVGFSDPAGLYQYEYYDNAATLQSAIDIDASGGRFIVGIDARLNRLGVITGVATDQATGAPVAGIRVTAYQWDGQYGNSRKTVTTGADGSYAINGLPTGIYRVGFMEAWGRYLGGYYRDAGSIASATDISVTAGQVTENVNAALAPWGQITGTITDRVTGQDVPGVWVMLWQWYTGWQTWYSSSSQADGVYAFGSLNAGVYRIEFYDPKYRYRSEFYADAVTIDAATDVTFTVGQTTSGINAALVRLVADLTPTPTATVTAEATPPATATVKATPTPTVTATVTPTATLTATSTPLSPWKQKHVYLPVILR